VFLNLPQRRRFTRQLKITSLLQDWMRVQPTSGFTPRGWECSCGNVLPARGMAGNPAVHPLVLVCAALLADACRCNGDARRKARRCLGLAQANALCRSGWRGCDLPSGTASMNQGGLKQLGRSPLDRTRTIHPPASVLRVAWSAPRPADYAPGFLARPRRSPRAVAV
jgi:hypothetical protein